MWKTAYTIVLLILLVVGATFGFNELYAKQADLELIAMRLDQKIKADNKYNEQRDLKAEFRDVRNRVWELEGAHNCYTVEACQEAMTPELFRQYRRFINDRDELELELYGEKVKEETE